MTLLLSILCLCQKLPFSISQRNLIFWLLPFFFFWPSFFYLITCFTHCRPPRFGEVMREPVLISRITWKMNLCCHAFSLLGTPYTMEISLHIMEDSICIYQILFVLREHRLSFDFQNWLLHAWLVTLDY